MRNKIKQLLKKEGGFTLVELLGVIVILGLIIGISIPLIGNVIEKSEVTITGHQEELIVDAAKMYELQGGSLPVDSAKLITDGYLEEQETGATVYTVTKTGTKYEIAAKE